MDIFSQFEVEEEEKKEESRLLLNQPFYKKLSWIKPDDYEPERHEDGWFMRQDDRGLIDQRDLFFQRASYFSQVGRHQEAFKILTTLRDTFEHKASFNFIVNDARLTSALRDPSHPLPSLLSLLETLRLSVSNYGDQIQYLVHSYKVHTLSGDSSRLLRSLILLCSLLDLPDHWMAMLALPDDKKGPNFVYGARLKALMLNEFQSEMARGFVREKMLKEQAAMRDALRGEKASIEEKKARELMKVVYTFDGGNRPKNDDLARPVHECRWKEGTMLTEASALSTLTSFCSAFTWFLEGMEDVVVEMKALPL